jgi:primosomal protein N' (replication factor Y) (superfamily II helicase)
MRTHSSKSIARVALDVPIAPWFDYSIPVALLGQLQAFDWVLVPWGRGQRVGIFLEAVSHSEIEAGKLKPLTGRLDQMPTFAPSWRELVCFAARYYQRSIGEIALPALPKPLKVAPLAAQKLTPFDRVQARVAKTEARFISAEHARQEPLPRPELTDAQTRVLHALCAASPQSYAPFLLFGVTGSGKTEVYLHWIEHLLRQQSGGQVLLLVPEISLTPRLLTLVQGRFPQETIAVLHSELADLDRAAAWVSAAQGKARLVMGTRLSVFTFKQPDAAFYSARDLALVLASVAKVPIVLGSATPSLESWQAALSGRYQLLELKERATGAAMPSIRLVKPESKGEASAVNSKEATPTLASKRGFSEASAQAVEQCLSSGKQALLYLNRRGYAPVLYCMHCGWLSQCNACSAYRVLHKVQGKYRLICHHCSQEQSVPRQCPDCGASHLEPLGQGTQGLEKTLQERFPHARLRRVDRDVAKRKGAVESILQEVHAGEADLLVGTQMLAKGHDFKNLHVVVVLDSDGALYSGDFRARERLFSTLMQVSGRAGRAAPSAGSQTGQVLIETRFADDPLFAALIAQDYVAFATQELLERQQVAFPPFQYQALLRVRARAMPAALSWLTQAKQSAQTVLESLSPALDTIVLHDPVPMPLAKLAHFSRAQLLVESSSRKTLQSFLRSWLEQLPGRHQSPRANSHQNPLPRDLSWQLEVDPLEI